MAERRLILAKDKSKIDAASFVVATAVERLGASRGLLRWVSLLMEDTEGWLLDAPCGAGRNALVFALLGCKVHCVDIDERSLNKLEKQSAQMRLQSMITAEQADLNTWQPSMKYGAIINVDWPDVTLVPKFVSALSAGGILYIESFGNRGENYKQLPKAGEYKRALEGTGELLMYKEKKAGPPELDAVTVKCVLRKHR